MTGAAFGTRRIRLPSDWIGPPTAPRRALVLTAVSAATWAATWAVGGRTVESAVLLVLAIGGAGATAYLAPIRPAVAFGIIFLLASLSRLTIELPFGTMRMEQPAIAFTALALVVDRRGPLYRLQRPRRSELVIPGLLCGYLAVLAISSVVAAPQPQASLRIVAWTAISLVGGVVAYVLLRTEPLRAEAWYRGSALILACAGVAVGAWYVVQGPSDIPGLSSGLLPWRKVYAFAWEPNLYASFLAAISPFAVERFRQRQTIQAGVVLAVILLAIGLGVTRGAYLGLAAGFAAYGSVLLRRRPIGQWVLPILAVASTATIAGALLSTVILATPPGQVPPIIAAPLPGGPLSSAAAGPVASLAPTPLPESPDTIAHRMERVAPALDDLGTSPWIGLGANSFGQRHADSSQGGAPDYIAILVVALVYESGIVGAFLFSLAVGLLLLALVRASRSGWAMGLAAAYLAAIVALLVAYQATNALVFGLNWLLGGAALALAARARDGDAPSDARTAQVP
jgi:hypothetical protein